MPRKVEISHKTVIFTVLFLLGLWFIFQIRDILAIIFVAIVLMSALKPAVDILERKRIPRALGIFLMYIFLWAVMALIIAVVVPPLVTQTQSLIKILPTAIADIEILSGIDQQAVSEQVFSRLGSLPADIFRVTLGVFSNIVSVLTIMFIAFYLLLERKYLDRYLAILLGNDKPARTTKVINEIERRLGGWVRGELILMLFVGILTYIGLLILGVDIALPLAIIAGLLEIIPNLGPTISAIPAILVALTIHPLIALATAALYFLVQLVENNILVPKIMQRAVGVNPLVSILGLMVGFRLAGPAGAILAIPLIISVQTIAQEVFSIKDVLGEV
jgi:predicted PurR-regulated permease PerM